MAENNPYAKIIEIIDDKTLVINKGSSHGIRQEQSFLIYKEGKELFDPDTKESLGVLEIVRGKGIVTHVQEKMATIKSKERKKTLERNPNFIQKRSNLFNFYVATIFSNEIDQTNAEFVMKYGDIMPFDNPEIGDLAKPI